MSEARIQLDAQVQVRRDIEANWAAVDPVLRDGEIAYSKDLNRIKVGDGARKWSELEYMAGSSASLSLDTEISETSENAVQNKVIKAYVDGKAAEAQAAAEQYIQNEVLTAYATTKYVGEREEYLVSYAEGLVNDLEKDINGRGYLTSAAMNSYATKEDIKNFVTKGSTFAHYGISNFDFGSAELKSNGNKFLQSFGGADTYVFATNTLYLEAPNIYVSAAGGSYRLVHAGNYKEVLTGVSLYSGSLSISDRLNYRHLGYGYTSGGWKTAGPALSFGLSTFQHYIQGEVYTNKLYHCAYNNGELTDWKLLIDEGNIGDYALSKAGGTIDGELKISQALTMIGTAPIRGDIPEGGTYPRFRMLMHPNGLFFQASTYDGTSTAGKVGFTGYGGNPAEDIYFNASTIRFLGAASFSSSLTLGGVTIKSWSEIVGSGSGGSDCITSNGGTINKDKYLYFGDASLTYRTTADGLTKLVISGLTEVGNLYVRERIWMEMNSDSRFGFRNSSTGESESISSFSDLKTLLNLMAAEATIGDGADFNNLTTPGAYTFMSDSISHSPTGYGNLLTIRGTSDYYISQLAIKHDGEMYLRTKTDKPGEDGDYWTEWRTIVDSASALTMLMGMGQGAVNNGSLNEVTRPGAYTIVGQSLSNYKYQYGTMLAISGTDDYFVSQLAMNASGEVSTRVREGGTWKNWRTLLDESNCGSYCLKAVSSDYYTFLLTSKTTDGVTRFVIQDANQSLLFGAAFLGGNTATIRNYVASRELRISDTLTFGDSSVGFYELMTAKGGSFTGNVTFNGGITLGGETINSWADVRSNWGSSLASVTNANMTMEVVPRVKKEIVTTLNDSHTITFNLTVIANTDLEWIIVFKTGSTVPRINIYHPTATLTWQNKENILNKLSPNTTYRIHIDHYLAMYETF